MKYFDLHSDTPYKCYKENLDFFENVLSVSAQKGRVFEKWSHFFAVWIKDDLENPYENYRKIIDSFKLKIKDKPSNLTPYFSLEGGSAIEDKPYRLYELKDDGIKLINLTWNGENLLAGGVNTQKGLTDLGKLVLKEMNRLKIGCDVSHLNEKSFFAAAEYADYIIASHSNCKSICPDKRNLTNEQIKLIAEKGGIIGICFYPLFLGEGDVYEQVYKHIYHICDMGLENHIAIGSDFDGADMEKELKDIKAIPRLCEYLRDKGMGDGLLDKIFFENANNFIAKL